MLGLGLGKRSSSSVKDGYMDRGLAALLGSSDVVPITYEVLGPRTRQVLAMAEVQRLTTERNSILCASNRAHQEPTARYLLR